jgi:hypothetical protein
MRYRYAAAALLFCVIGYGLAGWAALQMAKGGPLWVVLLIAAAIVLYAARWLYWKYEKPAVDAWQG